MEPAVHAVGNAGEGEPALARAKLHGRQLRRVREIELEAQRLKIRTAKLRRHVAHHLMDVAREPLEKVHEAG